MIQMRTSALRAFTFLLIATFGFYSTGCSTFLGRQSQTIRIVTTPPGKNVYYEGRTISDGERFTIRKGFQTPKFNVGTPRRPVMQVMQYDPDPGLIGDAAWLLFFFVPGVIAFGVDGATGSWRELHHPQHVYIQQSRAQLDGDSALASADSVAP